MGWSWLRRTRLALELFQLTL